MNVNWVSTRSIRNRFLVAIFLVCSSMATSADQTDMEMFEKAEALLNSGDQTAIAFATGVLVSLAEQDKPMPEAASTLGLMFGIGIGVTYDASKASKWHSIAADLGNPVSIREIGGAYLTGSGVEIDQREGLRFLLAAAKMGEPTAMIHGRSSLRCWNRCRARYRSSSKDASIPLSIISITNGPTRRCS